MRAAEDFLNYLNSEYHKLHQEYEELFWLSYMGDHSVDKKKDAALERRDSFRSDPHVINQIKDHLKNADSKAKKRLLIWLDFFERYQTPQQAAPIKKRIIKLETEIQKKLSRRKEGYVDPYSKKFISASKNKMGTIISTHKDEKIRKACFDAREKLAQNYIDEYIRLIDLRNQYARKLSYTDFYDFKIRREDGMTKKELFSLFGAIYKKTRYAFKSIRKLEKKMPGLRKPWNFGYMMTGDFTKEEDPYFQFKDALLRWGRSFAALGIDFKEGSLTLDLMDRKGKYSNGFCHWPELVRYRNRKKFAGKSNFTCNVVKNQIGSGAQGYVTLFHEGGHAAHLLNSKQKEVCLNHEYSPMSTSWAETQSMFIDSIFESIEWRTRYASNEKGEPYPLELFKRKLEKLHPLRPLSLNGIIFVSNFEREIYEAKNLNPKRVLEIARRNYRKYFDRSVDSLHVLNVPHIYAWESSGSYHGYGLAELALSQWREYFYKKYGYIVDNPRVGKEMAKVWQFAALKSFKDFVVMATGRELSAEAYIRNSIFSLKTLLNRAKKRIQRLAKVSPLKGRINLNAVIRMVDGKKEIANNVRGFEAMADKYGKWLS